MISLPAAHLRIARPTTDMDAAVRFWVEGLGMGLEGRKWLMTISWNAFSTQAADA